MQTPADKTATRLTREEWLRRLKIADPRTAREQRESARRFAPPADRVAVRN